MASIRRLSQSLAELERELNQWDNYDTVSSE